MVFTFDATDFTSHALEDLGRAITHYVATIVNDNETGKPTITFSAGTSRTAVFLRKEQVYKMDQSGWVEQGDAFMMIAASITIAKGDEIGIDSGRYRIDDFVTRYGGSVAMYKFVRLIYVSG